MSDPPPSSSPDAERPQPGSPSGPQPGGRSGATRYVRLRTAGIGFGAGLLNGLLGVGGGILIVPGMIFLLDVTPRMAVSTSLAAVLFMAAVALAVHVAIAGLAVGVLGTVLLLVAGVLGSMVGSYLLSRISQRAILFAFAAFTFVASVNLIIQGLGVVAGAGGAPLPLPLWSYLAVGASAGFLSGILGIGGGGIVVLAFATFFHTPILGGIPLALSVNVVNASSGVIAQLRTRQILWRQVARLVSAALVGVAVGVALAVYMPANVLKVLFGLFFLYMGARLFRRGARS